MNVVQTENSKEFSEKLELLLEDLDCENIEQADNRLNDLFELETVNDLERVANCLNAMSEWIFFRVSKIWSEYETRYVNDVWIFTHIECDWKTYELCIEDQYVWFENGVEAMIEDVIAYEKEANGLILSCK